MYRLFFLDDKGAIQAREDFAAPDDDAALAVSNLVGRACSDTHHSYELWHGSRRVIGFDSSRGDPGIDLADQGSLEIQHVTLTLEEARWRVARSDKLRTEMEVLKERMQMLLARQAGTQRSTHGD
jgi:hypothetical protein